MTADETVRDLSSNHAVVGVIYLSQSSSNLYAELKNYWRKSYEPNERIIVVQDCDDVYDYRDLPGRDVRMLQQALWDLDISNDFVVMVSPNPDLKQELQLAQQLYSKDQTTIHACECTGDYHKNVPSHDTFCVLPWMHLYVGPQGDILPCCRSDRQFPLGNINSQSISEILTSVEFTQLRADMAAGRRVKECATCWTHEDQGLVSPRMQANRQWSINKTTCQKDGVLSSVRPRYIDIRLSNLCNFKCRMCDSYYSSAIAQENFEMFATKIPVLARNTRAETLTEILEFLPTVEAVYFAGGEPLLCQEHYDIMDALIACGNTACKIHYNTNFSVLEFRGRTVIDLWNRFQNVNVAASLDAMGTVAEYVRYGTNWPDIEQNLIHVRQLAPAVNLSVSSTLSLMNVESLIDLQQSWHSDQKLSIRKFSVSILTSPSYLTLRVLPKTHKLRLSDLIDHHVRWCERHQGPEISKQWQQAKAYMWSQDDSHLLHEFRKVTNRLDDHRGQAFAQVLPQFQDML